ncbi:MAG: hypothetical protein WC979_02080 [Candidatus Pacearchaeota archaeon]|jgi:hypothetical protein|nr:hypothetical protein [Clostridia bacterium]
MAEKLKSYDNKYTFEFGKSYLMKYKRTTMFFICEPKLDWYRVEHSTSKDTGYAFINFSDIPGRYSYYANPLNGKGELIVRELTAAEIKERDSAYDTWEAMENQTRKFNYKFKK